MYRHSEIGGFHAATEAVDETRLSFLRPNSTHQTSPIIPYIITLRKRIVPAFLAALTPFGLLRTYS